MARPPAHKVTKRGCARGRIKPGGSELIGQKLSGKGLSASQLADRGGTEPAKETPVRLKIRTPNRVDRSNCQPGFRSFLGPTPATKATPATLPTWCAVEAGCLNAPGTARLLL